MFLLLLLQIEYLLPTNGIVIFAEAGAALEAPIRAHLLEAAAFLFLLATCPCSNAKVHNRKIK
jgi:hypothetical protein